MDSLVITIEVNVADALITDSDNVELIMSVAHSDTVKTMLKDAVECGDYSVAWEGHPG